MGEYPHNDGGGDNNDDETSDHGHNLWIYCADLFTIIKKKKRMTSLEKKNWLNIKLWETSASNHYYLLKAWSI